MIYLVGPETQGTTRSWIAGSFPETSDLAALPISAPDSASQFFAMRFPQFATSPAPDNHECMTWHLSGLFPAHDVGLKLSAFS
jgi:hypothetical protein